MDELIKEAEKLYKNIDVTQSHLIKARLDKDRIREHLELIGLETIVFDVKQLLKCIIDRKDNIVDLGEVWHDGNCVPEEGKQIFVVTKSGFCYAGFYRHFNGLLVNGCLLLGVDIAKYIYVEDLLPKGGEA